MTAEEIKNILEDSAYKLWLDIGERLVVGQVRYGGFKFAEYDLAKMATEEIEDFLVYITAKHYISRCKNEPKGP